MDDYKQPSRAFLEKTAWSSETKLSNDLGIFSSFAYAAVNSTLWVWWKDEHYALGGDRKADIITCYSEDGGLSWSDPEFVTDLGDLDVRFPSMAVATDGIPVIQWADLRNGIDNSAMFLKIRNSQEVSTVSVRGLFAAGVLILFAVALAQRWRGLGRSSGAQRLENRHRVSESFERCRVPGS